MHHGILFGFSFSSLQNAREFKFSAFLFSGSCEGCIKEMAFKPSYSSKDKNVLIAKPCPGIRNGMGGVAAQLRAGCCR